MTRDEFLTTPDQLHVGHLVGGQTARDNSNRLDVDEYAIVCTLHRGLPSHSHGAQKLYTVGRVDADRRPVGAAIAHMVHADEAVRALRATLAG